MEHDALKIIDASHSDDVTWDKRVNEEKIKIRIGMLAYQLRKEARLSQSELGRMIGVGQAMISRLEHACYDGDFFILFHSICTALQHSIEIKILPKAG
jgi:DNA-binding XRE family transcriptional regulator